MIYQIITGDFINSVAFSKELRESIVEILEEVAVTFGSKYEYFIRGDGIQILSNKNALREAIYLQSLLHVKLNVGIRLAIGIGSIEVLDERLSNSTGEAFQLSGQRLDEMKKLQKQLSVVTPNKWLNCEWEIHTQTLDYLSASRTRNQSEVVVGLLENKTQTKLAAEIGISQPSVNQRIKSSGWELIEPIILRYGESITYLETYFAS